MRFVLSAAFVLASALPAAAQTAAPASAQASPPSTYDPLLTFAPLTLPGAANTLRTSSGVPGPDYWQNRVDYDIDARLDPATKTLTASMEVDYVNNSPDALDVLWLQLDQNTYRPDARSAAFSARPAGGHTDGYVIESVEVQSGRSWVAAPHLIDDTRMRVTLPSALAGKGGETRLRIRYHFEIPGEFGGRMAWGTSNDGEIYDLAQWYPRMAVYDDLRGWDPLPYLANEFYLEYGAFDYAVTVPADMIVAGSGDLTNADEVLTADQRARLARARASDATVVIRTPEDVAAAVASDPGAATKTWRFHMDRTRDVAFTASDVFVWDAARINLPDGKTALAQSVYPVESVGQDRWSRSTEYMKHAVETFSDWYPYPWPNAINVAGPATGMEYPGIVFDGVDDAGGVLFWISAHEIGHSWFPMIVGFDERRDAWMDEGFNTFIDVYESDAFEGGVYGPKRDGEYAPRKNIPPADQMATVMNDPAAPAIMTRADAIQERYRHPITYFKSAFGLTLLREDILGPDRFDPAFRRFIREWAFKHPKPSDFFRAMESESGEDLSWFWRGWYLNSWRHDMAVTSVAATDGDPAKGVDVTVDNNDQLVLPATLRVTWTDGTATDVRVPVETWLQRGRHVFHLAPHGAADSAEIDPDHRLPDRDRSNNAARAG